jgi:hypothetical protein
MLNFSTAKRFKHDSNPRLRTCENGFVTDYYIYVRIVKVDLC